MYCMKKALIILVSLFLVVHPIFLGTAKAKTLGDLQEELKQKQINIGLFRGLKG